MLLSAAARLAVAIMLGAPPTVTDTADTVDVDAAREGITLRVGARAEDWTVKVGTPSADRTVVTMTAPDGWVLEREVLLDAGDPEARARQLAASVAVVIENYEPRSTAPTPSEPTPTKPSSSPIGFIALGPRLSTGPAGRANVAGGVALGGGAWLAHDHVVPIIEVGWRRSAEGTLVVHGLNISGGAAFGAPLVRGHVWLGGGVYGGALGAFARDGRRVSAWAASIAVPTVIQARLGRLFGELHAGPELTLPPLRFDGNRDALRWGHLRAMVGIRVGLRLGGGARFGFRGTGSV